MVRRTHHERTTAMQNLNHFCCSSMFGKTIVILFRGIEKVMFVARDQCFVRELSRFDNSQNVKMTHQKSGPWNYPGRPNNFRR